MARANKVESPYDTGAVSMWLKLLRPTVSSFLDVALFRKSDAIQIEELFIPKKSRYTQLALKDSGIRQNFNLIIIAIKKSSGEMIFAPHFETLLRGEGHLDSHGQNRRFTGLWKGIELRIKTILP